MEPALTDILCTACGLCCDGSLFADVELAGGDEATTLEVLGLEVEDPDEGHRGLLLQPCRALQGTRCSVYAHRPACCRTFECRLLQQVGRGAVEIDRAQEQIALTRGRIARIRSLIAALSPDVEPLPLKERCAEALANSEEFDADPETHRRRAELESAMRRLERTIRDTFLGG